MIDRSLLAQTTGVNGQVQCDCKCLTFEVGVAVNPHNGNNFIRVLQCTQCGKQQLIVHQSDAQLSPNVTGIT